MSLQVAGYQTEGYLIETELFNGPLDLLLELIERAELDITRVSLAQVTDQYLAYLNQLLNRSAAEVSAFLVIAARLVQIKSSALLPKPSSDPDLDDDEDLGEALARQLILYKRFKEIANWLQSRSDEGLRTYLRVAPPPKINPQVKLDLTGITIDDLILAAKDIFSSRPDLPGLNQVISMPRVTIREKINYLLDTLKIRQNTSFHHLLNSKSTKVEIVVTFLALLELVKRHIVSANQEELFGDIALITEGTITMEEDIDIEFEG